MPSYRQLWLSIVVSSGLGLLFCIVAKAQDTSAEAAAQSQTTHYTTPDSPSSTTDGRWHFRTNSYLWFAGVHGTAGALGRKVSVDATAGDVFSRANIGIMGAGEFQRNRLALPLDFMWIKLSDDKVLPISTATSAKAKVYQAVLTPKVGYLILDHQRLQIVALAGIRYWHLGADLSFEPSILGLSFSRSTNWVDGLGGGRITVPLSPKISVTVLGDAGGGGANMDYQVVGFLNYQIKPKWTLQGGWRYLDVDYRGNNQFVYDAAQSGLILGVNHKWK